jgi:hypothetical protein
VIKYAFYIYYFYGRKVLPVDKNFRGGSTNSRKFPRGGSIVMEPRQQVFPRGLRKIVNFRRGSTKNSEFPRGLNGMAPTVPGQV